MKELREREENGLIKHIKRKVLGSRIKSPAHGQRMGDERLLKRM